MLKTAGTPATKGTPATAWTRTKAGMPGKQVKLKQNKAKHNKYVRYRPLFFFFLEGMSTAEMP
jgi:hypothetical protein